MNIDIFQVVSDDVERAAKKIAEHAQCVEAVADMQKQTDEACPDFWLLMQGAEGDLTEEIPLPLVILAYMGAPIWTEGNFSVIAGLPGSRKTFLLTLLILAYLFRGTWGNFTSRPEKSPRHGLKVLWIDTEQSEGHVYEHVRRVARGLGLNDKTNIDGLRFFCLRPYSTEERLQMTLAAIEHLNPEVVIIDGLADLVEDVNSAMESAAINNLLLEVTKKQSCHICTVLHTNPGGEKLRGHVGSEVTRKAETVILTTAKEDITTISYPKTRGITPKGFSFRVNTMGLPEVCEAPIKENRNETSELFASILGKRVDGMSHAELWKAVAEALNISQGAAQQRVNRAAISGVIRKDEINGRYYYNDYL